MPQYAYFDAAQAGRVVGWIDTDERAYVLPPANTLRACSPAEWEKRDEREWAVQAGDLVPYVPPAPDIADEQSVVAARINAWRDEQEHGPIVFAHAGRSWDGGLSVRTRLQPMLSLPALPAGFFWTDAENNDVVVTMAELADLNAAHEAAIVLRGFEIHVRQRQMKAEVAALATVEAVRAYVIGWPA